MELLQLERVLQSILDWNQKCDKLLHSSDTLEMVDVYLNKVDMNEEVAYCYIRVC